MPSGLNARILICGMSRSGSTLLQKALLRYFEKYYEKELPVFEGANREKKDYQSVTRTGGSAIVKMHYPPVEAMSSFWHGYTLIVRCKRDIRDAAASNIISKESKNESLNREQIEERYSAPFEKELYENITGTLNELVWEYESWNKHITRKTMRPARVTEWIYEDFKKDEVGEVKRIIDELSQACKLKKLDKSEVSELMAELAEPVELTKDYKPKKLHKKEVINKYLAEEALYSDPERFNFFQTAAENCIKKAESTLLDKKTDKWSYSADVRNYIRWKQKKVKQNWEPRWNVGVSSTGGQVGDYKKFFNKEYLKKIDDDAYLQDWLKRNKY